MNKAARFCLLSLCVLALGIGIIWGDETIEVPAPFEPLAKNQFVRLSDQRTELWMPLESTRIIEPSAGFEVGELIDPEVVDLDELKLKNRIRIQALRKGKTSITFVGQDQQRYVVEVTVTGHEAELQHFIGQLYPDSTVRAVEIRDSVLLRGRVTRPEHAEELIEIAEQFYPIVLNQIEGAKARRPAEITPESPKPARKSGWDEIKRLREKKLAAQQKLSATTAPPEKSELPAIPPMRKLHRTLHELRVEVRELRGDVRRLRRLIEKKNGNRGGGVEPHGKHGDRDTENAGADRFRFATTTVSLKPGESIRLSFASSIRHYRLHPRNDSPAASVQKAGTKQLDIVARSAGDVELAVLLHEEFQSRFCRIRVSGSAKLNDAPAATKPSRIEAALERKVSLHFDETPLKDVVKQLAETSGVNVVLDEQGLQEEGIGLNEPVTLDLKQVKLRSALKTLLEPLQLAFVLDDEVLKITSRTRAAGPIVVVTYPVADLLVDLPLFVDAANAKARKDFDDLHIEYDWLLNQIRQTAAPNSWREFGGAGSIQIVESSVSLVIHHTPDVHTKVSSLLMQLRQLSGLQVLLEFKYIQNPPEDFLQKYGVNGKAGEGQKPVVLDVEETLRALELAQQSEQTSLFDAGRVGLRHGQTFGVPIHRHLLNSGVPNPILVQPRSSPEKHRVQLLLAVRQVYEDDLSFDTIKFDVPDGRSVLVEVTNRTSNVKAVAVEPGPNDFKVVPTKVSQPRVFLLLTPKIKRQTSSNAW